MTIKFLFRDHEEEYHGTQEEIKEHRRRIRVNYAICCEHESEDLQIWRAEPWFVFGKV